MMITLLFYRLKEMPYSISQLFFTLEIIIIIIYGITGLLKYYPEL